MSMPAFYCDGSPLRQGEKILLTGQEAAHARVLRVAPGALVQVFDGSGAIADCQVARVEKHSVELETGPVVHVPRPASRAIIALALSKAVRRGFFMEKAAELGAAEIWLWVAARSIGKLSRNACESCASQLVAGAKQSRNPWFPRLRNVCDLSGLLEAARESGANWRVLPWEEQDRRDMLTLEQLGRPGVTLYVIGPEGGLEAGEAERFTAEGFIPVSLGSQVLRCETAATLCLGLHYWAASLSCEPCAAEQ